MVPMLEVKLLCKSFGETRAVDGVDIAVENGEMLCLLGPSGCGKTTLLMMLSGFLVPDSGTMLMDGSDVTALPPEKRPTALVFQNYALFPHLTVFENIAFGLRARRIPVKELSRRVEEMLSIVGLDGKGGRAVTQLSGGQQQRVALARALVLKPKVLLLDEPLSNLDAKLRVETRQQIRSIQKSVGITSIFVTHDQEEALAMADRIAVMREGHIEQHGSPLDIYAHPCNRFVADFIGKSNFLAGNYHQDAAEFELASGRRVPVPADVIASCAGAESDAQGDVVLVVRPEHLDVAARGEPVPAGRCALPGVVVDYTFLGESTMYTVDMGADGLVQLSIPGRRRIHPQRSEVAVHWDPMDCRLVGA